MSEEKRYTYEEIDAVVPQLMSLSIGDSPLYSVVQNVKIDQETVELQAFRADGDAWEPDIFTFKVAIEKESDDQILTDTEQFVELIKQEGWYLLAHRWGFLEKPPQDTLHYIGRYGEYHTTYVVKNNFFMYRTESDVKQKLKELLSRKS